MIKEASLPSRCNIMYYSRMKLANFPIFSSNDQNLSFVIISEHVCNDRSSLFSQGTICVFMTATVPGAPHTVLMAVD